jgi:hypothetical protein
VDGQRPRSKASERVYRNPANRPLVPGIITAGLLVLAGGALSEPASGGMSRTEYLLFTASLAVSAVAFSYWRCYPGWGPFFPHRVTRAPDRIAEDLNALLRERQHRNIPHNRGPRVLT